MRLEPTPSALTARSSDPSPAVSASKRTPIYKKWWLWTALGIAAAGIATGIAVGAQGGATERTLNPVHVP
jgi:hypothetical protein